MTQTYIFTQIVCKPNYTKSENATRNNTLYKIDTLSQNQGHTVAPLQPYHRDLISVELIWAKVTSNVAAKNVTSNLEDTYKLAENEFRQLTAED